MQAFLGRGAVQIRRRRLGGGAVHGSAAIKLHRVSQGDEVDASSAQYFGNSSLAPVLLIRRRMKSVADVLRGIRQHGFSHCWWDALCGRWNSVCEQPLVDPVRTLEPLIHWIHPDLHGFYKWVFDALGLLNDFVKQVVVAREESGLRVGNLVKGGFRELGPMPGSGLILCLTLPFWPSRTRLPRLPTSWFSLISLMPSFVRPGCRFSAGLDIRWLRLISSWTLLTPFFLRSLF